jgi:hypothetical protein
MTDEPKKPMTATEFVERNRELKFAKGGYLHFPQPWQKDALAALTDGVEYVVPKDDPRARMHRHEGTVTGRWSGKAIPQFVMQISMQDKVTPEFVRIRDILKRHQYVMYYGTRIADLLMSKDPRQRKRGNRLKDKRRTFGLNLGEAEARMMVERHRQSVEGAKLKAFWNTELGEPWDPTRYRKD